MPTKRCSSSQFRQLTKPSKHHCASSFPVRHATDRFAIDWGGVSDALRDATHFPIDETQFRQIDETQFRQLTKLSLINDETLASSNLLLARVRTCPQSKEL